MAVNIGSYMEQVARHYWGEPNAKLSSRHQLRWGTHGSKSVDLRKGTWFDHEEQEGGGVTHLVRSREGASLSSIADILQRKFGIDKKTEEAIMPRSFVSKCYDYYNADGVLSYQVQRFEPKTFRQRRPDGNGGWINNMRDVDPLPYNLPAVMSSGQKAIYIVEGEKCADRLVREGKIATTNHGGAKNWKPELAQYFLGKNVVVIPDNDQAGMAHANLVVSELTNVAKSVRMVELPGVVEKGDICDWLDAGNTVEHLTILAKKAEPIVEKPKVDDVEIQRDDIFQTYSLSFLRSMPPVEWCIEDVLTKHGFSVMYGEPGAGKSFLALDMALSMAYGEAWQGKASAQGAVLYIAGEGVGGLGKRIHAWQAYHGVGIDAPFFVLPTAVRLREPDEVEKLMRTIDSFGMEFSAVFVDTVARALLGGDENSATDMGMFVDACDAIKKHVGCALMGIHHSGKDVARGMRGSTALLGAVDTSIRVARAENLLSMKMEKQKDAEPCDDMTFRMEEIALIGDSSIVLSRKDDAEFSSKINLGIEEDRALEALRQLFIDRECSEVSHKQWTDKHRSMSRDAGGTRRMRARQRLQDMGIIGVSNGIVREIKKNPGA